MYSVKRPVCGLRVGALSSGKLLSMSIFSNITPSFLKLFKRKLCVGQKVSSGKLLVLNRLGWLSLPAHNPAHEQSFLNR